MPARPALHPEPHHRLWPPFKPWKALGGWKFLAVPQNDAVLPSESHLAGDASSELSSEKAASLGVGPLVAHLTKKAGFGGFSWELP